MNRILLVLILMLFFKIGFAQNQFPYNIPLKDTLGNKVPSVILTNSGKPLILDFFGTYCKPCILELDSLKEFYSEWQRKYGVKIIVVVTDVRTKKKTKKLVKMIKEHDWPFHFYLDPENTLYDEMTNTKSIPQTFIFDGNRNMISKFIGIKPNYGYLVVDGKITEKVKLNKSGGKYSHLEIDLIDFENALEFTLKH